MSDYNRRDLFKALGASAVLLHPIMSERYARADTPAKKRFVVSLTSSGVMQDVFWPKGDSKSYDLKGTSLEPLDMYKSDLTIVKGLRNDHGSFDSHSGGAVALLTGDFINKASCRTNSCDYANGDQFAKSASIDQMIAMNYAGQTPVSSLVMSLFPGAERQSKYISYDKDGRYIPQATNPYAVFDAIFKDLTSSCDATKDAATIANIRTRRKSILDAIKGDLADAVKKTGLSAAEKQKLDTYTESIRQIEKSMDSMANNAACTSLKQFISGTKIDVKAENYMAIARLMMDLICAAFQLDVTRVATICWSVGGVNGVPSTWAKFDNEPIQDSYHSLTHGQVDPKNWPEKCRILDKAHANEFAYLVGQLKGMKEGSGTILDNSLALWTSEIGEGSSHTGSNIPWVMAGRAGGFQSGRYVTMDQTLNHGALISILKAFDINTNKIGRLDNLSPLLG